jgi:hypothetical protein
LSQEGLEGVEDVLPDENGPVVLRVIEESAEHRSRRERETDRFHITSHPLHCPGEGKTKPDESSPGTLCFVIIKPAKSVVAQA